MVTLTANPSGGTLLDTDRRDVLNGGDGADTFVVSRDGKTDSVYGFDDGTDLIDLSDFSVNWAEVQVKYKGDGEFVITIRGERTIIQLDPLDSAEPITADYLTADDFIFATNVPDPVANILADSNGKTVLYGTDQSDIFVMFQDNTRDVIKNFDPFHDLIDLSSFGITFEDLQFNDVKDGKIVIQLGTEGLVIRDLSGALTSGDLTEDMFVFV
jgi:hypothetical protein